VLKLMHVVGVAALTHQEEHNRSQDPPPPEQTSNARPSRPCKNVLAVPMFSVVIVLI
jgi:hypothetical protein